jgi:hypothetical protein
MTRESCIKVRKLLESSWTDFLVGRLPSLSGESKWRRKERSNVIGSHDNALTPRVPIILIIREWAEEYLPLIGVIFYKSYIIHGSWLLSWLARSTNVPSRSKASRRAEEIDLDFELHSFSSPFHITSLPLCVNNILTLYNFNWEKKEQNYIFSLDFYYYVSCFIFHLQQIQGPS